MREGYDIFHICNLFCREICYIFCYLAGGECLTHILLVYQKVAREIEDHHTVLHHREGCLIKHSLCIIKERDMYGDIVTLGKYLGI